MSIGILRRHYAQRQAAALLKAEPKVSEPEPKPESQVSEPEIEDEPKPAEPIPEPSQGESGSPKTRGRKSAKSDK